MRAKDGENSAQVVEVALPSRAVDQDVIEEDENKATKYGFEDSVHESLEGGRCVRYTKRHDSELIMTFVSSKSCILNIIRVYADLMIASFEIELGEDVGTVDLVK